jgi:hypothetical protein
MAVLVISFGDHGDGRLCENHFAFFHPPAYDQISVVFRDKGHQLSCYFSYVSHFPHLIHQLLTYVPFFAHRFHQTVLRILNMLPGQSLCPCDIAVSQGLNNLPVLLQSHTHPARGSQGN